MTEYKGFWRWLLDKMRSSVLFILWGLTTLVILCIIGAVVVGVCLFWYIPVPFNILAVVLWLIFLFFVVMYIIYRIDREPLGG